MPCTAACTAVSEAGSEEASAEETCDNNASRCTRKNSSGDTAEAACEWDSQAFSCADKTGFLRRGSGICRIAAM